MTRSEFESQLKEMLNPIQELYKQYVASNPEAEMTHLSMWTFTDSYHAFVLNEEKLGKPYGDETYYADLSVFDETEEN
jgi:hypothetical protein